MGLLLLFLPWVPPVRLGLDLPSWWVPEKDKLGAGVTLPTSEERLCPSPAPLTQWESTSEIPLIPLRKGLSEPQRKPGDLRLKSEPQPQGFLRTYYVSDEPLPGNSENDVMKIRPVPSYVRFLLELSAS